ncbi:hypothetical protein EC991_006562 [Linnemannia zychae]|nr:hypothetical protein EC991_006562 [Linnemannia zychae]
MSTLTPELILYLEPTQSSTLHTQTQSFFASTATTPFAGNEATRYPPHTTMVGFFNQPSPPTHTTATSAIVEFIDHWLQQQQQQQANNTPKTVINGCLRPDPTLLLIGLTPSPALENLTQLLSSAFPDLGLRCKQINHLSLCYWDDPSDALLDATSLHERRQARIELTNQATHLAQSTIPMIDIPAGTTVENESWDVVLYSIQGRDKASGLPYPLQEIKRWTLPSFL